MLALITHLDGANAQLFHVEHCGNRQWQYQARWPASPAAEYRDWGPIRRATGDQALEPLMDPNVICEVRWRWEPEIQEARIQNQEEEDAPPWDDPDSSLDSGLWTLASCHEWGPITCEFHVITKFPHDFRTDPLLHAAGLVRGHPVAFEITMPSRVVAITGKEILTLPGTAISPGPSAVLREPAEFVSANDHFSISNAGPSQVTLLPVEAKPPGVQPSGPVYAVRLGILPPEEIELLRAYVAAQSAAS